MCKCWVSGWLSVAMETVCSSLPSDCSLNTRQIWKEEVVVGKNCSIVIIIIFVNNSQRADLPPERAALWQKRFWQPVCSGGSAAALWALPPRSPPNLCEKSHSWQRGVRSKQIKDSRVRKFWALPEFCAMMKATLLVPGCIRIKPHSLWRGLLDSALKALNLWNKIRAESAVCRKTQICVKSAYMKLMTGCPTWLKWSFSVYRKGLMDGKVPSPGSSLSQEPSSHFRERRAGFSSADAGDIKVVYFN